MQVDHNISDIKIGNRPLSELVGEITPLRAALDNHRAFNKDAYIAKRTYLNPYEAREFGLALETPVSPYSDAVIASAFHKINDGILTKYIQRSSWGDIGEREREAISNHGISSVTPDFFQAEVTVDNYLQNNPELDKTDTELMLNLLNYEPFVRIWNFELMDLLKVVRVLAADEDFHLRLLDEIDGLLHPLFHSMSDQTTESHKFIRLLALMESTLVKRIYTLTKSVSNDLHANIMQSTPQKLMILEHMLYSRGSWNNEQPINGNGHHKDDLSFLNGLYDHASIEG